MMIFFCPQAMPPCRCKFSIFHRDFSPAKIPSRCLQHFVLFSVLELPNYNKKRSRDISMKTLFALAAALPLTAEAFMVAPFMGNPLLQQLQHPHFGLGLDDWFFDPFGSSVASRLDASMPRARDVTKPLQPVLAADFVETENDFQIHAGECSNLLHFVVAAQFSPFV
jgi:hypothetical protein